MVFMLALGWESAPGRPRQAPAPAPAPARLALTRERQRATAPAALRDSAAHSRLAKAPGLKEARAGAPGGRAREVRLLRLSRAAPRAQPLSGRGGYLPPGRAANQRLPLPIHSSCAWNAPSAKTVSGTLLALQGEPAHAPAASSVDLLAPGARPGLGRMV